VRVLLIDPDDGFRRSAVSLLETIPFVDGARGTATLEQARVLLCEASPPDVVLLSFTGSDAFGAAGIRSVGDSPARPRVVALTVFDEPGYPDGVRRLGAHDWLPKSNFAAALGPCLDRLRAPAGPPEPTARTGEGA
jgi:DNA-binding NarL/FixJ family response regulator